MWQYSSLGQHEDQGLSHSVSCEEQSRGIKKPLTWRSPANASLERWANPQKTISDCFKTRDNAGNPCTSHNICDTRGPAVALSDVLLVRRSSTVELSPNLEDEALEPPTQRGVYEATRCPKVAVASNSLLKPSDTVPKNTVHSSTRASHMCYSLLSRQQDAQRTAEGMFGSTNFTSLSQHFDEPSAQASQRAGVPPSRRLCGVPIIHGLKHASTFPEPERRIPGLFKRACQQDLASTAKKQCIRPTLGTSMAVCNSPAEVKHHQSSAQNMISAFDDTNSCEVELQDSEESDYAHKDQICSPSVSSWMMPCSMAPDQQPASPVLAGTHSRGLDKFLAVSQATSATPVCDSGNHILSPTHSVHTPPERIGLSMEPPGAPVKKTRAAFMESELQYMSSGELYDASERSVFDHGAFAPSAPEWSPRQGVRRALRFDDLSMED